MVRFCFFVQSICTPLGIRYNYREGLATKKDQLDCLSPGFYSDRGGALYVDMAEFLAEHGIPDTEEFRGALWQEIYRAFGPIEISEI